MTGLKCCNVKNLHKKNFGWRIRHQYFGGIRYFKLNDLDNMFDDFDFANMDDTDVLRIALLCFADSVLCARPFERRITKEIMHAVNDLDYFNNFYWGTYTWKMKYECATQEGG